MAFFVFRGIDHPGMQQRRAGALEAHRAYVRQPAPVRMLHGGPLHAQEGHIIGSCLILEAASKAEVDAWLAEEPLSRAQVFATVSVDRWGWTYGR